MKKLLAASLVLGSLSSFASNEGLVCNGNSLVDLNQFKEVAYIGNNDGKGGCEKTLNASKNGLFCYGNNLVNIRTMKGVGYIGNNDLLGGCQKTLEASK